MGKHSKNGFATHSVKFNAVMNILLTASNMLVNVITIPYVTRTLSVEGYGDVNFAYSVSTWLSAFCLVGIPLYGVRECARVRDNKNRLIKTVCELLGIITIFTVCVLSLFAIAIFVLPQFKRLAPLMWIFFISTLLLSYGVEWYFQAVEDYQYITIRSVIFKLISLVATLLFVRKTDDWYIYGIILALVMVGNNLLNLIRLFQVIPLKKNIYKLNFRKHLKPLFSFAVLSIATSFYNAFDTVLLGILTTNREVAFYQLASKLRSVLGTVINAIIGVLIPRLSYYAKNNISNYSSLLKKSIIIILNLCCGASLYLAVYAKPAVIVISSDKYIEATLSIRIISIAFLFSCLSYFIGLCILTVFDREKKLAQANLIGVPISICLNVLLDPALGATGAAISILIAEFFILVLQIHSAKDIILSVYSLRLLTKDLICHIIAFIISVFSFCLFNDIFIENDTSALQSFLILMIGFFIYIVSWIICAVTFDSKSYKLLYELIKYKKI